LIFNITKPPGWTSFDVVKKIRIITKHKKVGHAGTLDPFATGVLIVGTEKDTKTLHKISSSYKTYEAVLELGKFTDTLDVDGKIISRHNIPSLSNEKINLVLESFKGRSTQIPPMFSAKKVNGLRLYQLARKGISIERNPNEIHIKKIKLLSYLEPLIYFRVECSKGTYIRVLGKEIAEKLSTVGFLVSLNRIQVGDYKISDSLSLETFEKEWKF
jgi:tRNA pseudouridine55 synthase